MRIIRYPGPEDYPRLIQRPEKDTREMETAVTAIIDEVRRKGDAALRAFTSRFDRVEIDEIEVPATDIATAGTGLGEELKEAINLAARNIDLFHRAQADSELEVETAPGVICRRKSIPIEKVGLYVPGGSAPLLSTVLMLGIPAKRAGCREIALCTPPEKDGRVNEAILYAARVAGLEKIYRVGGAQAIAAMAFGTESIPRVYKIFGPGNQYVTTAKQLAARLGTAIDMPAGPSELAVMADESADPVFVAADLLSQAEHGPDSQVVLAGTNEAFLERVLAEVDKQVESLPRKDIARTSLASSMALLFRTGEEVCDFINAYAPEHLIIAVKNFEETAERIVNAGSVFLGNYSPESVGDYTSGTNHTLPTNGYARTFGGVSLDSFVKKITFQHLTEEGLKRIGEATVVMAHAEGLAGHARAVELRLEKLRQRR